MSNPQLSETESSADGTSGEMLRDAASRLLRDVLTPSAFATIVQDGFSQDVWSALEALGLPSALLPDDAGGFGVPIAEALSLLVVAGAHALPLPLADTMLARFLMARAGIEDQSGPLTVAAAARAETDSAGRVTGEAWSVPWGRHARSVVLVATGRDGPKVAAVPREAFDVELVTNLAGEPRDTIRFRSVIADTAEAPVSGHELRALGAATRALMMAGALQTVSAMTAEYAQERKQFGRAIGKFQAVQQSIAVLAGQSAAASAAGDLAAEAVAAGANRLIPGVAAAKIRAGEAAGIGAAIAHQVHGAIGFTQEHRLHEYTRRLWAWRDEYGREAEWARELGRHLLTTGPEGLWPAITAI